MLVDTMTYKEMAYEYARMYKDHLMMDTFNRMNNQNGPLYKHYRRYMIKHRQQKNVCFKPIIEDLDANSKFVSIPMTPDYKCFCKHGIGAAAFLVYRHHSGLLAFELLGFNYMSLIIYTHHFFDRYVERFLHGEETSRIDTICKFIKNNRNLTLSPYPFKEYPYNMLGLVNEVVLFGESIDHNITLLKTCVTKDMLFDKQLIIEAGLDKALKKCELQRQRLKDAAMKNDQKELNRISNHSMSVVQWKKRMMHPDDDDE